MNTPSRGLHNLFARRSLLMYFILAYAFFWGFLILVFLILGLVGVSPDTLPGWVFSCFNIIGSWMPNLAAVTVIGLTEGRAGSRALLEKYGNLHIPARWLLAALAPLPLMFAAAGLYNLAGGTAPGSQGGLALGFLINLVVMSLVTGATGEEAGWRGFALPRLQSRFGPLAASLVLALAWDLWHFPLWMISGMAGMELLAYILAFSLGIFGLTFFMTWLYNRAPNSLVPMIIAHFTLNFSIGLVGSGGLGLAQDTPLMALFGGLMLLTDLLLWTLARRRSLEPALGASSS